MEWLALGVWLLVLLVALPLGSVVFSAPPLGLAPPLAIVGLALAILFAVDGAAGVAWAGVAVAAAGVLATGAGAAQLIADEEPATRAVEHGATFAGAALPLYATAAACSLLAALAANGSL